MPETCDRWLSFSKFLLFLWTQSVLIYIEVLFICYLYNIEPMILKGLTY